MFDLFKLSMFGVPIWALAIIMVAIATIAAFAIMWILSLMERKKEK